MDPPPPAAYLSAAKTPPPPRRRRLHPGLLRAILLAACLSAVLPAAATAQRSLDGVRIGMTFGGTGLVGVSFEFFADDYAVDLTLATWSFSDLSASVVGKHLFGASAFRPSAGLGLWLVWSARDPEDPDAARSGLTLLASAPLGFDMHLGSDHYLNGYLNVSRGLWIRRTDPDDDTPLRKRLVPLPGLAWRWDPSG